MRSASTRRCGSGEPTAPETGTVRFGGGRLETQVKLCAGRLPYFIIGCECEAEARRIRDVLPKRFTRFRLTIHPEKTALMACKRPPSRHQSAGGTGTFDFLGLTHYWAKTRQGYWVIKRKTVGKRLRRFMKESWTWCRENRHAPLQEQYRTLGSKLRGYYHYYGIRGHFKRLEVIFEHTERAWH